MDRVTEQVNKTVLLKSNRFIAALKERGMRIQRAYLFGSFAKGHSRRDSDFDLAIVSNDLKGDWLDDFCYLTRIADDIDARMEVIPFLPRDFRDDNPLVWEIKTNGIPLIRNGNAKRNKRRAAAKRKTRTRVGRGTTERATT